MRLSGKGIIGLCLGVLGAASVLTSAAARDDRETAPTTPARADSDAVAKAGTCVVTCQPPIIAENEPCPLNTVNCGCDCAGPPLFLQLRCPEGYCGETWAQNNQYDTDWYRLHVNDLGSDGQTYVCLNVEAEVPMVVQIFTGACPTPSLIVQGDVAPCVPTSICACVTAPAFYKVKVYPGTIAGGPTLTGLPCGPPPLFPKRYTLQYSCQDDCPGDPLGACCYQVAGTPNTYCIVTTQSDCLTSYFNSVWLGASTSCVPDPCHDPADPTGACCYQIQGSTIFLCTITTQADCLANYFNSTYLGDNTTCSPDRCNPPPDEGACCFTNAEGVPQCTVTTQVHCETVLLGLYLGNNTTCNPDPCDPLPELGACCYQQPGLSLFQCIITTQQDCIDNHFNATWLGPNTTCTPDPCNDVAEFGACCYFDAVGPQCIVTTQPDCLMNYPGGTWLGVNTTCGPPNPCDDPMNDTGACCYQVPGTTQVLCVVTTQGDCLQNYFNGIWLGPNTTCNPDPCQDDLPLGACCYLGLADQPFYFCVITSQPDCHNVYNGTWLGAGTSCVPDPCNDPPSEIGACCFQEQGYPFWYCTQTTQQHCLTSLFNGTWMGAGTPCIPDPCPDDPIPSGACCYEIPGVNGEFCIVTTQADCLANYFNGAWLGSGVPCTPNPCDSCVRPPPGMVAWFPLDETVNPTANEVVYNNDGTHLPVSNPPTPVPGQVAGGLFFDGANDIVVAPHSSVYDFNCGAFSIDAWVRPNGPDGTIVEKKGAFIGYTFGLDGTGKLALVLETSSLRCVHFSTGTVPVNTWTHVAVTATAASGGTRIITFYINGAPSGSSVSGCDCFGNSGSLVMGDGFITGRWRGVLDEIELFDRVLTPQEVNSIFSAGSAGKCKHRCHVQWDWPFCLNQNQVTVPVTLCNDSNQPHPYMVTFQPLPVGPNCSIPGPTVFNPLFSNPVNIPPFTCVTVNVQITRPTGMNAVLLVGCYQINVTNLDTNQATHCHGSVQDRRDLCAVWAIPFDPVGVAVATVGVALDLTFEVENTGDAAVDVPLRIDVMNSHDMLEAQMVSLNGLPPGTRYIGNLVVQPGSTETVPVSVLFTEPTGLDFFDIVLWTDMDGGGVYEPLISRGLASALPPCSADCAPPPDGQVNVTDLLALLAQWGLPGGGSCDINGDGQVNVTDLLALLAAWGVCP